MNVLLNIVISMSKLVKITQISHLYYTYVKLLKLLKMDILTLGVKLKWIFG